MKFGRDARRDTLAGSQFFQLKSVKKGFLIVIDFGSNFPTIINRPLGLHNKGSTFIGCARASINICNRFRSSNSSIFRKSYEQLYFVVF